MIGARYFATGRAEGRADLRIKTADRDVAFWNQFLAEAEMPQTSHQPQGGGLCNVPDKLNVINLFLFPFCPHWPTGSQQPRPFCVQAELEQAPSHRPRSAVTGARPKSLRRDGDSLKKRD